MMDSYTVTADLLSNHFHKVRGYLNNLIDEGEIDCTKVGT